LHKSDNNKHSMKYISKMHDQESIIVENLITIN